MYEIRRRTCHPPTSVTREVTEARRDLKRHCRKFAPETTTHCLGPKEPSRELINAVVEIKRRNPRFGCPRIAYMITLTFGTEATKMSVDGVTVYQMFNHAISGVDPPKTLSTDNDPLFKSHRWQANLRILNVNEIKSTPYAPMSHPFIERVIGTIRREYLDHVPFWNSVDLERKLNEFKDYYNNHRTHEALSGQSPAQFCSRSPKMLAQIDDYAWRQHCRGLFHTPVAI